MLRPYKNICPPKKFHQTLFQFTIHDDQNHVTECFAEHSWKKIPRFKEAMCLIISFSNIFGDFYFVTLVSILLTLKFKQQLVDSIITVYLYALL